MQCHYSCCCQYSSRLLFISQPDSRTRDDAYVSIILVRKSLTKTYKLTPKHIDNHVSCIRLKTLSMTCRFASVYLRPSIADHELTLNTILDNFFSPTSIFCLSAIARNLLWNSSSTGIMGARDHRGYNFELIFHSGKFNIVTYRKQILTLFPEVPLSLISRWREIEAMSHCGFS